MSGLDQRTKAHAEALGTTTAVNDSTPSSDAAPWPAVAGELLGGDALDTRRHSVPAFPLELLPQPWRDWIGDAARLAGAPVDYVAQAVLASVAGIGGRRVAVLPTPGWQEPLRLWLAAVGLSAAGKSPALESVSRQLWLLEGGRSDRSGGEPRSIKLPEAPFARVTEWLRRDRRGTVLWRDDAVACLAPPAGARSVRQLEPYAVSIVGTAQPGDVERTLRQDPDSAARFLYAWPQHQPFRRLPGLDLPSSALQPLLGRLLSAFDGLQKPHALLLDAPAAQAFEAFRARRGGMARQGRRHGRVPGRRVHAHVLGGIGRRGDTEDRGSGLGGARGDAVVGLLPAARHSLVPTERTERGEPGAARRALAAHRAPHRDLTREHQARRAL
jgi:hypothetical protein